MIDWSRVNELRSEIGEEDFEEVVELFIEEVQGSLEQLQPNLSASQLEATLHFLKGSALNLGFSELANLCQSGETTAAKGDTATIDVNTVKSVFTQSNDMFQKEFETHIN